jgi:ABC-type proline/glycine betaine transport system permease subunit
VGRPQAPDPARLHLALYKSALVIRVAQAGTREVMGQDYIRFARAKGLKTSRIVGVHVLKNIMIPVVTVLGLELGSMIAFAVVTETVFAYPGMGKLLIDSINRLDRPIIVAYLMMTVVIFVAINLAVDLLYAAIDPRVRLADAKGEGWPTFSTPKPPTSSPSGPRPPARRRREGRKPLKRHVSEFVRSTARSSGSWC